MSDITFAGSIPEHYDTGLGPVLFEPYAVETARRMAHIQSGAVLEVACGTGRATRRLRETLPPQVKLVATDLSESMLDYARQNVPGDIEWRQADAQELPFPDATFDGLVCQFCLMFVRDKELAIREFRRVLKPGGKALVWTWDSLANNPITNLNKQLLEDYFPVDPPRFLEVPFSMHDADELRALFATAFEHVDVERVKFEQPIDDVKAVARGMVLGNPVAPQIAERDPQAPGILLERLEGALANYPVSKQSAWVATAS